MKAVVCTKYGPPDVLQLKEVEKPVPRKNEVCVKIFATTITASDCIVRGFAVPMRLWLPMGLAIGFTKPRNPILGMVLAGEVESLGEDVTSIKKGDQVYAINIRRFGAYAEYVCWPGSVIVSKPSNVTCEEAAAIPFGGHIALHYLKRRGNVQSGQRILIYGASGAIGTSAVQLARYLGAEVTGVCSTANLELVKFLGADIVIDYTEEDRPDRGELYDLIFDAVGKKKSSKFKSQCKKALAPNGKYISVDDGHPEVHTEDLLLLKELVEAGQMKPVIDRCYTLEQIAEAHRYVDEGHKKGNVVITVGHKNKSILERKGSS
jgi:NADPH:quinone reductase-like Zn-dependent oxidoreductase